MRTPSRLLATLLATFALTLLTPPVHADEPEAAPDPEVTSVQGEVRVPARQRTAVVVLSDDLMSTSAVEASVKGAKGRNAVYVKAVRPNPGEDQFVVVLSGDAPKGGALVGWIAANLQSEQGADADEDDKWEPHWVATLVLVGFAVGGALLAYLIAAVRQHADGATAGDLEFVSLLKVLALITLAGVALVGAFMTDEFTALFGLLGAIAGYLAGNRPSAQEEEEQLGGDGSGGGDGGGNGGGNGGGGDDQEPPADEAVVEGLDAPTPTRVVVPRKRVTRRTRSLL